MQDRSRINYRKNKLFITVATVAFLFLAGCGNRADESGLTEFSAAEEPAASEHASDASVRADPGADGASAGDGSSTGENNKDKIFVYVCGAVCAPGVYELDEGARVYEAVQEAGGMSADASADSVNLARVAQDALQGRPPPAHKHVPQGGINPGLRHKIRMGAGHRIVRDRRVKSGKYYPLPGGKREISEDRGTDGDQRDQGRCI